MPLDRAAVPDAQEWLRRAQSNLAIAFTRPEGALLEDLCFEAQQAAEKAIKAVLIQRGIVFPFVHDLAALLSLVEASGLALPNEVASAAQLTQYAVLTRYPGVSGPVSRDAYEEALKRAEDVVRWAEEQI